MEEEAEIIIKKSWEGPEHSEILSSGHAMPSTHEYITAIGYLHETYKNSCIQRGSALWTSALNI